MVLITSPAAKQRSCVYTVQVQFGDCDPAGIVWFPNFFRWIDAASRNFFSQCGVPRWEDLHKSTGIIGTPLVDTHCNFKKTASYGDTLEVHTSVSTWRDKSFVQSYQIRRARPDGEFDVILECEEVRIFAVNRNDGKNGIRAVAVPADIRSLCE